MAQLNYTILPYHGCETKICIFFLSILSLFFTLVNLYTEYMMTCSACAPGVKWEQVVKKC